MFVYHSDACIRVNCYNIWVNFFTSAFGKNLTSISVHSFCHTLSVFLEEELVLLKKKLGK
tara:strand:+ start:161 stop:340 length:180 start_codon:yes stop_codon:yes gene_type:complete